jgi:hypothetical protein
VKVTQEADQVDRRMPFAIVAVTFLCIALSVVFTIAVRRHAEQQLVQAEASSARRPPTGEAWIDEQPAWLFARHEVPASTRAVPPELTHYGWEDRGQGLVHIPIDRAKQLFVEHVRATQTRGVGRP